MKWMKPYILGHDEVIERESGQGKEENMAHHGWFLLYHMNIILFITSIGISHMGRIDILARVWVECSEKSGNGCTPNISSGHLFRAMGEQRGTLIISNSIYSSQGMSRSGAGICISINTHSTISM